jgi:hypothetical protein
LTTYQILELLKTKGMNAAGTIRVNRFHKPPLLSDPVMKKSEHGYSDEVTSWPSTKQSNGKTLHQDAKIRISKAGPVYFV